MVKLSLYLWNYMYGKMFETLHIKCLTFFTCIMKYILKIKINLKNNGQKECPLVMYT